VTAARGAAAPEGGGHTSRAGRLHDDLQRTADTVARIDACASVLTRWAADGHGDDDELGALLAVLDRAADDMRRGRP
jgi:hypothetical protein